MAGVEVRALDRSDQDVLRAYWELGKASMREVPYDQWPSWEFCRRTWSRPSTESDVEVCGVHDGDRLVGAAFVGLPLLDNPHLATFELAVDPGARRRGIGTALLAAVEDVGARRGRTTFLTDTVVPVDGRGAGVAFGRARGYAEASRDECKVVDLAARAPALPGLEALAAERLGPYRLVSWQAPVPEEWLEDICTLRSAFLGEVPLEDLDLQPRTWTPSRYREREERYAAAGLRQVLVAAVAPDGALAGYADAFVTAGAEDRAEIGGTLVLPAHRGHRLGLAMKVRLHQRVTEVFPDVRTVLTFNAGVNAHMNAVNDQLGYRVLQHVVGLQKKA